MIESNIIGKKDAEELAEMFNEEHKKKPVYEDFKFSAKEKDHLLEREEETKRILLEDKLPVKPINGELKLQVIQITGLRTVPGMDVLHYKVKQFFWEKKDGAVKKVRRNALPAFPANFQRNPDDESQATIHSKVSLRKDLFGQNLHA